MATTTDRPSQGPPQRPRKPRSSGTGRYVRTEESAERDALACRMHNEGSTYPQIAEALGYADHSGARKAVARALAALVAEPAGHMRTIQLARIDLALVEVFRVMRTQHIAVSNGRVIMDPADPTKPLRDDGPTLAAIDRLIRLEERRAKLLGLDAPTRVETITVDQVEAEINRLAAQLGVNDSKGADR